MAECATSREAAEGWTEITECIMGDCKITLCQFLAASEPAVVTRKAGGARTRHGAQARWSEKHAKATHRE